MTPFAWTAAALFAGAALTLLALSFVPLFLQARAEQLARRLDIALPESQFHTVRSRLARRYRGVGIGAIVGAAIAVITLRPFATGEDGYDAGLLTIGLLFAGAALGVAVSSVWRPVARDPEAVTVARTQVVRLRDYVAPIERQGARVVVAVAVVLFIVALARGLWPAALLAGVMAVLGVAFLVFFEVAGRRIVARPQPASSRAELEWDDALRSAVLRDIVTAPLGLGAYSALLSMVVLTGSTNLTIIGIASSVIVVASIVSRPHRYFLRQLWDGARA